MLRTAGSGRRDGIFRARKLNRRHRQRLDRGTNGSWTAGADGGWTTGFIEAVGHSTGCCRQTVRNEYASQLVTGRSSEGRWNTRLPGRRTRYALAAAVLLLGPFGGLTAVVVLTAPGVFFVDADVAANLHHRVLDHPDLGAALRAVGLITHPDGLRVIAAVSAALLWRQRQGRTAAWLLVTMTIGGVLGTALKQVFARSRPEWPESITVISGYSFPSGHALNSMLAAGCAITILSPRLKPVGRQLLWTSSAAFVLLVGFDRVALGVHYLTDVLAGWAMALAVLFATLAAFDPNRHRDLRASDRVPSDTPP